MGQSFTRYFCTYSVTVAHGRHEAVLRIPTNGPIVHLPLQLLCYPLSKWASLYRFILQPGCCADSAYAVASCFCLCFVLFLFSLKKNSHLSFSLFPPFSSSFSCKQYGVPACIFVGPRPYELRAIARTSHLAVLLAMCFSPSCIDCDNRRARNHKRHKRANCFGWMWMGVNTRLSEEQPHVYRLIVRHKQIEAMGLNLLQAYVCA